MYKEYIKRLGSSVSFLDNLKTSKRRWEGQLALATQAYEAQSRMRRRSNL